MGYYSLRAIQKKQIDNPINFNAQWSEWENINWVGPQFWGNRLQDWSIVNGLLKCNVVGKNRSLHLLTHHCTDKFDSLKISTKIYLSQTENITGKQGCIGMLIGASGPFDDFRSAAVFGKGINIGINPINNTFLIDKESFETGLLSLPEEFEIEITILRNLTSCVLETKLKVNNKELTFQSKNLMFDQIKGGFALIADINEPKAIKKSSISFGGWNIKCDSGITVSEENTYGPIMFAQYTINDKKLKLTAQLAPVEDIHGHSLILELFEDNQWNEISKGQITNESRTVKFEINHWEKKQAIPYRLTLVLPLKTDTKKYSYYGTISKIPDDLSEIKAGVFSCNFHYGFPDADVVKSVKKLSPDLVMFLGDQFYEGTGGFPAEYEGELDWLMLDYLHRWYIFGWSFRDLYRHVPCILIPDDHDIYHGNVWGANGKAADTSKGFGAFAQDSGGYKMPAEWIKLIQQTQTSHLPDPYDPTPVEQGIGVYYTHWKYGGISFAILEDRKFKSPPNTIIPKEADVNNGWIMNSDFDVAAFDDSKAELLGTRQESFLENWVLDWSGNSLMKVVLSQTNFTTLGTLPAGSKTGAVIPSLSIPEKGTYIEGDIPTKDMDTNGWPIFKRNKTLAILRRGFAFHIAGDQHLASFLQYGIDEYNDSGYAFTAPALSNIWPRRFWPAKKNSQDSSQPPYIGNHLDGFGNKMSVYAIANPIKTNIKPEILHDRAVGFGLVTFDKTKRTITTHCWPRHIDPTSINSCYDGWPITINQLDNFAKKAAVFLPEIVIPKLKVGEYVLHLFNASNDHVYSINIPSDRFKPKAFSMEAHTIKLENIKSGKIKIFKNIKPKSQMDTKQKQIKL